MRAGELRHRIELFKPETVNGDLGPKLTYVTAGKVWANVKQNGGGVSINLQAVQSAATYTISIRYHKHVAARWRATWNGHTMTIVSATNPDGRKMETILEATEGVEGVA